MTGRYRSLFRQVWWFGFFMLAGTACGSPASTPGIGDDDDDDDDDNQPAVSRLIGEWHGEAEVSAGQFVQAGTFPATLVVMQDGPHIRGFLDIEQDAAALAEAFAYLFDGTIDADGNIEIRLTDRMCGAGDPEGLCYPVVPALEQVFTVGGKRTAGGIVFHQAAVLPGVGYAADVPFDRIELTRFDVPGEDKDVPLAGSWDGACRIPMSVVYLAPLPLYGQTDMRIEGSEATGYQIVELNNQGINIIPTFDDVVLADSLRFDAATGRTSFVQLGTTFYNWLFTGLLRGNQLTTLIDFNAYDDPYFDPHGGQAEPPHPLQTALLDEAGVCTWTRLP